MSPQLAAGTMTLKLGFPHGAVHLMKEFIQLERGSPASWAAVFMCVWGVGSGGSRRAGKEHLAGTSAFPGLLFP